MEDKEGMSAWGIWKMVRCVVGTAVRVIVRGILLSMVNWFCAGVNHGDRIIAGGVHGKITA